MEKSLEKMEAADIVIYLFDVADPFEEIMERKKELIGRKKPFLLVLNKIDTTVEEAVHKRYSNDELLISTKINCMSIDWKQRLVDLVVSGEGAGGDGEDGFVDV